MRNLIKGIYTITNIINDKYYVGSSLNVKNRLKVHKQQLIKNIHPNNHLQGAWNKYGEDNFKFEIVLDLSSSTEEIIRAIEQEILDKEFNKTYNLLKQVLGTKRNKNQKGTKNTNKCKRKSGGDVLLNKKSNKWRACITVNDDTVHLGCFDTYEEALECRLKAEKKYWAEDYIYYKRPTCIPLGYRKKGNSYEVNLTHNHKTYSKTFKTEVEAYEYVKKLREDFGILYK